MKETVLYNEWQEPEALSVTLEDVRDHLLSLQSDLKIDINYDDYDDYGCEHYLVICGECADLVFKKDYGGMYSPSDCLVCSVQNNSIRDESTFLATTFSFKNDEPQEVTIGKNYAERITKFFDENKKYLNGSSDLFRRTERFEFDDPRGDHLYANRNHSFCEKTLDDCDFHTAKENIFKPEVRNIKFWTAKEANVLSTSSFDCLDYSDVTQIDEWRAIELLIKDKNLRWVVDTLIDDKVCFCITDDGFLDACEKEDDVQNLNLNLGIFKDMSCAQVIEYATKNGFKWETILDIVSEHSVGEEYDEEYEWTVFAFIDKSELIVFDHRKNYVQVRYNV